MISQPTNCRVATIKPTNSTLCGLAYNVFALMRQLLPDQWATTIRWRLYGLAGKLIHHGRQWTLKLCEGNQVLLNDALQTLRQFALPP